LGVNPALSLPKSKERIWGGKEKNRLIQSSDLAGEEKVFHTSGDWIWGGEKLVCFNPIHGFGAWAEKTLPKSLYGFGE
jgi:hypothetical protein